MFELDIACYSRHHTDSGHTCLSKDKKAAFGMDGEDESICDIAEKKLNTVLMIISIAMICAFFLISATYSGGFAMIENI